ncbi:MAG: hypothetical protein GY870_19675 [archaeon]|nr:hypothetical protein [archaeon]
MKINIFQFNGCDKCFNETLLLNQISKRIHEPEKWVPEKIDYAIITGYLIPENKKILETIKSNSKQMIAFGSCTSTGGIYGLAYQKGNIISPINKMIEGCENISGCLAEIEELERVINGESVETNKKLCNKCSRKSTCDYLDEVYRVINITEDEESCFNDLGLMCSGYIARECKELCVESGAPCRGCKPSVDRPGLRMLGLFGTLMGNIEVATEATGKGGTDKLADEPDDVTKSIPDVTGNFFRFSLANTVLPIGKNPSTGNILSDIMIGRPIEELPMILGHIGGKKAISTVLHIIEAYETINGIEINNEIKEIRNNLIELERELISAIKTENKDKFKEIEIKIRELAGNMNLSKLFYGGFRNQKENIFDFEEMFNEGPYESGPIKFSVDSKGIITEFIMEG